MPSAPDENQRPEPLKDILGLTSANPAGSIVDSIQTLRNLAHQLSLAEISETEKKVKQTLAQLSALQETLKRLKKLRLHVYPVSPESQPEAKPKNLSKSSAANVIPFPLFARGSEGSAPSDSSATAKRPLAEPQDKSESYPSGSQGSHTAAAKPDLQKLREQFSALRSFKWPETAGHEKEDKSLPAEEKSVPGVHARSERESEIPVRTEDSAQEITSTPNDIEPAIPEIVVVDEQPAAGKENVAVPSKRTAVDEEIKELVKTYGQVDIYSHRESDGKQNLRKAALTGFLLIVVLVVSYFFLR